MTISRLRPKISGCLCDVLEVYEDDLVGVIEGIKKYKLLSTTLPGLLQPGVLPC